MKTRAALPVAFAVASLVAGGCDREYVIPPPAAGVVELYEWQVLATAPPGTTIRFVNGGIEVHNGVISTPEGQVLVTSGLLQSGETREVVWSGYEGPVVLTCRVVEVEDDGEVEDHVEQGMFLEATWG